MTQPQDSEKQSSPEKEHAFPLIGDVVSTSHFPLGVVMSSHFPDGISAAAIVTLEDGTEKLGLPGTINIADVHAIEGHWDVDRVVAAWAKTWESMGAVMTPEKQAEFRSRLIADAEIDNKQ